MLGHLALLRPVYHYRVVYLFAVGAFSLFFFSRLFRKWDSFCTETDEKISNNETRFPFVATHFTFVCVRAMCVFTQTFLFFDMINILFSFFSAQSKSRVVVAKGPNRVFISIRLTLALNHSVSKQWLDSDSHCLTVNIVFMVRWFQEIGRLIQINGLERPHIWPMFIRS